MGLANFNLATWLQTMLLLVIGITLHEFAHALAADRLGDRTPREQGRISLNPADHLSLAGMVMMAVSTAVGYGLGWGKPVLTTPSAFRNPRRDMLIVAVCGPLSNLLQATVFAALLRLNEQHGWLPATGAEFVRFGVIVNLVLFFFNLIPIPPMDGAKVLAALLPSAQARAYETVMGQWGLLLFFVLIFTPLASYLIAPPVAAVYRLLVG